MMIAEHDPIIPHQSRRQILFSVIAVLFLGLLILRDELLSPRPPLEIMSASNLRQIGQAILIYTQDNAENYPDSFQTLLLNEDINSEVFVSPLTSDTPAQGPTTQVVAAQLTAGGHLSYVYLGRGLTTKTATPDTVVAYQIVPNSRSNTNVLYGDGHVVVEDSATAAQIIAKAAAGKFPVTMP